MSDEPTGSVTVKPRDKNVPHPYDSRKMVRFPSETFPCLCGQLRRLIRRNQVILDTPEKADKKDESPKADAKTKKRKGGKGHQAKPVSTDS